MPVAEPSVGATADATVARADAARELTRARERVERDADRRVEHERRTILRALGANSGDRARTADALQVGYKALLVRMKELGIEQV